MTERSQAFRRLVRLGIAGLVFLAAAAARAQSPFPPIVASATVGVPSTVSVQVPLRVTLAQLAATNGATVVYNTGDAIQIAAFGSFGLTMPITVQKLATAFPGGGVTINALNLAMTGDARFSIAAGGCATPVGTSCMATASYSGAGPSGLATPRVTASVPSITVTGAGLAGAIINAVYPLLSGVVSNFLVLDLRVTIAATIAPDPNNHTALWWNPDEAGWGINVNHQGDIVFATLFTYDTAGAPYWLVMSEGRLVADQSYSGALYRTNGPAFNAVPFTPIGPSNLTQVGSMTITWSGDDAATLSYTVNGITVTKSIRRQRFGSKLADCTTTTASRAGLTNVQDLWWNNAEAGWGINLTHQDDIVFATLFTYDAAGHGLWLVMSAGVRQPDGSFTGALYRTTGPSFDSRPFTPIGPQNITQVGSMTLRFADGEHGTLAYSIDGVAVTKEITRQVFASPVPSCRQ